MGSIGVAAFIAKGSFVGLLAYGYLARAIAPRAVAMWTVVGLGIYLGLSYLNDSFITPIFAIIDIILVFAIFKGDVRIT